MVVATSLVCDLRSLYNRRGKIEDHTWQTYMNFYVVCCQNINIGKFHRNIQIFIFSGKKKEEDLARRGPSLQGTMGCGWIRTAYPTWMGLNSGHSGSPLHPQSLPESGVKLLFIHALQKFLVVSPYDSIKNKVARMWRYWKLHLLSTQM